MKKKCGNSKNLENQFSTFTKRKGCNKKVCALEKK